MSGIIGNLCISEKDLKRSASVRKKPHIEKSITPEQAKTFEQKGWDILREGKTRSRVKRPKSADALFEDRLWMIFYNLGLTHMNLDYNCRLQLDNYQKQIDVLARDEENIFIVECRSSSSEGPYNAKEALEEYAGKREAIQKAIEAEWGRGCGRINIVIAISSQEKREKDIRYAASNNIFLWSAREISYIENLIKQVGISAKNQLYSVIFANKRQKSLKKEYPAIKGKIGGNNFYSFMVSAKQLLKYAYVHHRDLTGIIEASQVYQRMLNNSKLREIANFIDIESRYFPNSIIVNFSKHLGWHKKEKFDDNVSIGLITLPEYYGSAWIIDGQHRLYGAARAINDVLVPVLAFENINALEQANLFVEINEKQTSVPKNLLWDLYSDIYRDSEDEKQKLKFKIAETAKRLEESGPLSGYIDIHSIPKDRPVKFSLTTICSTIEKYSPWNHIKHPSDENKDSDNAARIINSYFSALRSLWPEDWEKGKKSILLSNNGFGVFMMVFQDIINHIAYKDKTLLHPNKAKQFEDLLKEQYLTPLIEYLKADEKTQKDIKSKTGRGPQSQNAALLDLQIQYFVGPDFSPPRMKEPPAPPPDKAPPAVSSVEAKSRLSEGRLRIFTVEKLKRYYGSENWWKQGLPGSKGGIKERLDKKWSDEIKRKPYLRREKDQNERKFEFIGLGDIIEIVVYRHNWENIFEPIFIDKVNFERRIKDIAALRHPSAHVRRIDEQDVADGTSGLLWLSNCLTDKELNPYI